MNAINPAEDNKSFDKEVERVLTEIGQLPVDSDDYRKAVENLKILCEARGTKPDRLISIDTIVNAATSIVGILLVLNYERMNVITSKAFGYVIKGGRG